MIYRNPRLKHFLVNTSFFLPHIVYTPFWYYCAKHIYFIKWVQNTLCKQTLSSHLSAACCTQMRRYSIQHLGLDRISILATMATNNEASRLHKLFFPHKKLDMELHNFANHNFQNETLIVVNICV